MTSGIVFRAHLCEEVDIVLYSVAVVCVVLHMQLFENLG